MGADQNSPEYI